MKFGAFPTLLVASAFILAVSVQQVANIHSRFPFLQCNEESTVYSLAPTVESNGEGTHCFTLRAAPPAGCTSFCCTEAGLHTIEFHVKANCNVEGATVVAAINGVPIKAGPSFHAPGNGLEGSTLMRLTQLGPYLNTTTATSDGAHICITLLPNHQGEGCTSLEQLCEPPPDMPAGVCSAALYDRQRSCCRTSSPGVAAPSVARKLLTSSPQPPPSSPGAPPRFPPDMCKACVSLVLVSGFSLFPASISDEQCRSWSSTVIRDIAEGAVATAALQSNIQPSVVCGTAWIEVCGIFSSDDQAWFDTQVSLWWTAFAGKCPAYYDPYQVSVGVWGFSDDDSYCLSSYDAQVCDKSKPDFPKCRCDKSRGATPFFATPFITTMAGRRQSTTLHCFTISVILPEKPMAACSMITSLNKAEVWADYSQRRKVKSVAVQPAGSASMRFMPPSWGPAGDQALKVTSLDWSLAEADGGKICIELDSTADIKSFCNTGLETCWITLFDKKRDCCPLYSASL